MYPRVNKFQVSSFKIFIVHISIYCLLFTISVDAQNYSVSPYSRYGIGELQDNGFAKSAALGGSAIALQNDTLTPFFINALNPASYASIRLTTFEAGAFNNTTMLRDDANSSVKNAASLEYISLAVPFTRWWSGCFGLMPYSSVGYKISDQKTIDSVGTVNYLYQGTGGINRLYFGNAIRIKNLYLGVNVSYLFGSMNYVERDLFSDGISYNTKITNSTTVNDIYFDYGLQYTIIIDSLREKRTVKRDSLGHKIKMPRGKKDIDDVKITFGLTTALKSNLSAVSSTLIQRYTLDASNDEIIIDTIQNTVNKHGVITLPFSYGAGVAVKKGEKFLFTGDYSIQNWSDFSLFEENANLKNSMKISFGAQYVPGKQSDFRSSYWKRVNYRIGMKYYKSYLNFPNSEIDEYVLSLGLGLPVGRMRVLQQFSMLNVAFELGQNGTTANNLLKEQFFRVTLGVTINDRWFIKSRFD